MGTVLGLWRLHLSEQYLTSVEDALEVFDRRAPGLRSELLQRVGNEVAYRLLYRNYGSKGRCHRELSSMEAEWPGSCSDGSLHRLMVMVSEQITSSVKVTGKPYMSPSKTW